MEEKFNSFEELVENISRGGEVEFLYKGKAYSVLPVEEGIVVCEQYNDDNEMIYDKPISVAEFKIGDEILRDVILKAEIV